MRPDRDLSQRTSGTSSSLRYHFRKDLKIVRTAGPDMAGSDVTVIDPRSDEQHVFTADEFTLCMAANGTNSLAAIHQVFKVETGRDIALGKVFTFFRRLRSKGLLDEPAAAAEAAGDLTGPGGAPSEGNAAPDAKAAGAESDQTGKATPPGERLAAVPSLPVEPAALQRAGRRARHRRLMQSRGWMDNPDALRGANADRVGSAAARKPDSATEAAADPSLDRDEQDPDFIGSPNSRPVPRSTPPAPPSAGRKELGEDSGDAGNGAPGGSRIPSAPGGFGDAGTGLEATANPGGAGGSAGFGAGFGGGLGSGMLRQMLGGGFEGRGGGAGQNFLAGLAARARAAQEDADAAAFAGKKEPARFSLFNPNAALGLLATLTWPLKFVFVPLLLAVPAAAWIAYQHRDILAQDIRAFDVSVVGTVILSLAIANLICRLTQGTFIRGFGARVEQFGIALTFGIPRFFVELGGIATLGRRGQLWVHAAPLIARLGLCCAGTLLWFALRQSAPSLSHLALVVGQIGLLAFLLSALPLLPSDGYRWLATYLGRPALRSDALRRITGRPLEAADGTDATTSGSSATTLYVLAIALTASVMALVGQIYFDIAKTGDVRLITAALLLGVGGALAAWVIALWNYGRGRQIEVLDSGAAQQVLAGWTGQADLPGDRPVSIGTIGKVFWAVVACALLAVAFLPYRYEAGGTFEILPTQRTRVAARTTGEVEQVLVREGDWVQANQVLAKLSSDDQQRNVTITKAELDRAKAQLAQFGGKAAAPADSALEQSIDEALKDGTDTTGAKKDAAGADYTRTEAERAARAEVERLTHKLAFERDQVAQASVRAPKEGRVMTPNVHLLTGTWLPRGSELLSLADTRTLEAEINVPEADIGLVKVGDKVRVRPWSDEDREIAGTVTEIAPAAQDRPYGKIVRVRAAIPNDEAFLRPAMTGYAKIEGEDMRVWEAFLRRIIRIVRVEMWSWIP